MDQKFNQIQKNLFYKMKISLSLELREFKELNNIFKKGNKFQMKLRISHLIFKVKLLGVSLILCKVK